MYDLIATLLSWFYGLVPDYGFAIAMLTVTVMLVLTPLTLRATKSMLEMQRIQPELKRLQAEHKGDRQALNEEVMKLYKEHKVNPVGGCLPLLLQAPVFFVLYNVLRGLTRTCDSAVQIERGECTAIGNFRPDHIAQNTRMFDDLVQVSEMNWFGFDLSRTPVQQVGEGIGTGWPYILLILLMAGLSYFQQWQISLRSKVTGQIVNRQQQILLRVLPAGFAVISLNFPAGLIVYWTVQNIVRIIQNYYITRRFYGPHGPAAMLKANKDDDGGGSSGPKGTPKDGPAGSGSPTGPRPGSQRSGGSSKSSNAASTDSGEGPSRQGNGSKAPAKSNKSNAKPNPARPAPAPRASGRATPPPKPRPTPRPKGRPST
jgi:YidC/Oxa1 family membrane protein insertase